MKQLALCLLLVVTLTSLSIFIHPIQAKADSPGTLSLSDAILADLALHNYLDYVSIYFKDKKSPNTITINENRQWLPASTVKLYVAMFAFDQINSKNISLNQWVTIDDKNVVPTELESGDFPVLTAGLTTTVDTLLKKMITQSDNTSYNTLLDLLDRQEITAYIQKLGLTHTIVGSKLNLDDNQTQFEYTIPGYNINTTTATDYEKAYELIDSNQIAGSKELFDILKEQKIRTMIPALLPVQELTIGNKTGDLDPLYHDGGIVIGNGKHYILTIFTNLGNPNIVAHLSQLIFTQNYKLVGADIPEKNTTPAIPQALDPLVINAQGMKPVLGVNTANINVPIPQITAADLGITSKDLSLTIPNNKLPQVVISPTSPIHGLVAAWYGIQTIVAVGQKNRQEVSLSYAKQLLSDAKQLQKDGNTKQASATLQGVEQVLKNITTNSFGKPDAEVQTDIKAVSDTQFSFLKANVDSAKDDNTRIAVLQLVANTVKEHITDISPNIPAANAATAPSNQPLIAHVTDVKDGVATVVTSSGTTITVPFNSDTKVIAKENTQQAITPAPSSETPAPQASPNPSPTETSMLSQLKKGQTIALLGTITGNVLTPSVILTNLHKELAAPQPVAVIKVDTQNNTMVISENGNPVQVNLGPQTPIKAKDTNVPLQTIQTGSVIVVHGTKVEQVASDSQKPTITPVVTFSAPQPTIQITQSPQTTSTTVSPVPASSVNSQPSVQTSQQTGATQVTSVPTGQIIQPNIPSNKSTGAIAIPTTPVTSPSTPPSPATPVVPKVINATSVQVVQQKPNTTPPPANQQKPATNPQIPHNVPAVPNKSNPSAIQDNKKKK